MDVYQIWCNLAPGTEDLAFCTALQRYLGELRERGLLESFRILRRKLGLGPPGLGEFQVLVETRDLAQLDAAFGAAAQRAEPVEGLHAAVNQLVRDATFALYRDFPDAVRRTGQERF